MSCMSANGLPFTVKNILNIKLTVIYNHISTLVLFVEKSMKSQL